MANYRYLNGHLTVSHAYRIVVLVLVMKPVLQHAH